MREFSLVIKKKAEEFLAVEGKDAFLDFENAPCFKELFQ